LYKMWRHWRFTSHCYSNLVQMYCTIDICYSCAVPTDRPLEENGSTVSLKTCLPSTLRPIASR
jgi:hypothetical protein